MRKKVLDNDEIEQHDEQARGFAFITEDDHHCARLAAGSTRRDAGVLRFCLLVLLGLTVRGLGLLAFSRVSRVHVRLKPLFNIVLLVTHLMPPLR